MPVMKNATAGLGFESLAILGVAVSLGDINNVLQTCILVCAAASSMIGLYKVLKPNKKQ